MPHHDHDSQGTGHAPEHERHWTNDDFKVLDDRPANTIRQILLATGGMFVAFFAAEWVDNALFGSLTGAVGLLVSGVVFALFGSIAIGLTSAMPIRKALIAQRDAIADNEEQLKAQSAHHRLVGRLQAAFDMAESDVEASQVVSKALDELSDSPAEMLLADSSRAHLRQVAESERGSPGCGVTTPWGCPAVRRSRTLVFEDSTKLEACPRLCERDGDPISATCVPVTILGTPMGVIHVTGEVGSPSAAEEVGDLEALAEQAGSRIGVLRAMASSQLQATTDPLTGLLNRRSLEAELEEIREVNGEFAAIFLDLDHFKDLNDTFGHDTGDRVLRSFASSLRRCSRDNDTIARYGGEEFVVLLPDASMGAAAAFFERLQDELESVSERGDLPAHTCSGGVADSSLTDEVREVLRLADLAMYRAKQEGRNAVRFASGDMATGDAGDPAPGLGISGRTPAG